MKNKFFMWRRWKEADIWGRPTDPTNEKKRMGEEEMGFRKMGKKDKKIKVTFPWNGA